MSPASSTHAFATRRPAILIVLVYSSCSEEDGPDRGSSGSSVSGIETYLCEDEFVWINRELYRSQRKSVKAVNVQANTTECAGRSAPVSLRYHLKPPSIFYLVRYLPKAKVVWYRQASSTALKMNTLPSWLDRTARVVDRDPGGNIPDRNLAQYLGSKEHDENSRIDFLSGHFVVSVPSLHLPGAQFSVLRGWWTCSATKDAGGRGPDREGRIANRDANQWGQGATTTGMRVAEALHGAKKEEKRDKLSDSKDHQVTFCVFASGEHYFLLVTYGVDLAMIMMNVSSTRSYWTPIQRQPFAGSGRDCSIVYLFIFVADSAKSFSLLGGLGQGNMTTRGWSTTVRADPLSQRGKMSPRVGIRVAGRDRCHISWQRGL